MLSFPILLMAGSLGHKSMEKVLKRVVSMEGNYRVLVVCGKNKELKKSIQRKYYNLIKCNKIILYGFTNDIPNIMENSDIIITKPGGLTVSEAIAKKLPMIIPYYIPGHEKENLDFLVKNGLAIYVDKIDNIKKLLKFVMENPKELDDIRKSMEKLSNSFRPNNVVYLGEDLIENHGCKVAVGNGF